MVKYNKTVSSVIQRAIRNGSAKSGSYEAFWYPKEKILVLQHYGTKIFQSEDGKIVRLGGYSQSDASAISTALKFAGYDYEVTNNKKRASKLDVVSEMNGWYIYR